MGILIILSLIRQHKSNILGDNTGQSRENVSPFFIESFDNKVVFVDQFNIYVMKMYHFDQFDIKGKSIILTTLTFNERVSFDRFNIVMKEYHCSHFPTFNCSKFTQSLRLYCSIS